MTGSEKQIAWAQEIQSAAVESIRFTMEASKEAPEYDENNPEIRAGLELWERRIRNIENCAHARNIIDNFKGVKASNSPEKNFAIVYMALQRPTISFDK